MMISICLNNLVLMHAGYLITHCFIEVRWCFECGCQWIPDQLGPVPEDPLHAFVICPCHLCWESIPWAALCCWDHHQRIWAIFHDGQMWSTPRQVHGLLPNVLRWCCVQGHECCGYNHLDQVHHSAHCSTPATSSCTATMGGFWPGREDFPSHAVAPSYHP